MQAASSYHVIAGLLLATAIASAASGEDFRVENKVFSGDDRTPISQSTTLFRAGRVYDYLKDPQTIAMFDKPRERFVLMDPAREVKTEVTSSEVLAFTARLHTWASSRKRPYLTFAADPHFEVRCDEKRGQLDLTSPFVSYSLETAPANTAKASAQYREFSDWYARLNAMIHPGSNPPFVRLAVNDELAQRNLVARKVTLNITAKGQLGGRDALFRSEHQFAWRLLPADIERIAKTASQIASFESVSFSQFSRGEGYVKR